MKALVCIELRLPDSAYQMVKRQYRIPTPNEAQPALPIEDDPLVTLIFHNDSRRISRIENVLKENRVSYTKIVRYK
ncbi:hypothetical protein [Neptuniibacter sp. QD37_11]|uniref:hypothetical protein n=1 Tax=Neptuniibacter sp. QD37_11 TaxID=3398209 RepID=UPI0039F5B2B9